MTTSATVDVAVYYHDDLKAPLLRAAVLPALRLVPAEVTAHLRRGWLHGPHLRIRLTGRQGPTARAAAAVADRLAAQVAAVPSSAALTRRQLLDRAVTAGRAELVPPPYEPFVADNTVRVEVPSPDDLGDPAVAATRTTLLGNGIRPVTRTLECTGAAGDTAGARVMAAVVALAAHADTGLRGLANGHLSYRSHLEHHLHHHDPHGRTRARHTAIWARHGREVCELVAGVSDLTPAPDSRHAAATAPPAAGGLAAAGRLAAAWREWSIAARRTATAAGALGNATYPELAARAAAFDDAALLHQYGQDVSEFHRSLRNWAPDDTVRRRFEIERLCVNMLYQLLAVADVTPAERYLAVHLLCAAVETLTGLTVWELLGDRAIPPARAAR